MSSARIKGGGRAGKRKREKERESGRMEREGRMGSRGRKVCEEDARRVLQKYVVHTHTYICGSERASCRDCACVPAFVGSVLSRFVCREDAKRRVASEKRTAEDGEQRTGVRTRTRCSSSGSFGETQPSDSISAEGRPGP